MLFFPPALSRSQEKQVKFNRVDGTNGVPLGKINAIVQDPRGFMWFADQNNASVMRYDGYTLVGYRKDPGSDILLDTNYSLN